MPEGWPDLSFDDEGVCSWCSTHRPTEPLGEEALLNLLRTGRGRRYDCVVGVSGGKDSCYVASHAVRRLGLRVVAVAYDHPFVSDLARKNATTVCERLGIELEWTATRSGVETALVRDQLPSLAATGITLGLCDFCRHGITATVHRAAAARDVPFILMGTTAYERWGLRRPLRRLLERVRAVPAGDVVRFACTQLKTSFRMMKIRRELPLPGGARLLPWRRTHTPRDGPQEIAFYDYVQWDHDLIERTLEAETGWEKPAQPLSWRYDCALEPVLDLTLLNRFGISRAGLYLASLVRDRRLARDRALDLLAACEDRDTLARRARAVVNLLALPETVFEALAYPR